MERFGGFEQPQPVKQEKSEQERILSFLMDSANLVVTGEYTFGDVVWTELGVELESVNADRNLPQSDLLRAKELRDGIPYAEVSNIIQHFEDALDKDDLSAAAMWYSTASSRLTEWVSKDAISEHKKEMLLDRMKHIQLSLNQALSEFGSLNREVRSSE